MKKILGVMALSLLASACDAQSAGGCDARGVDGTCRDWFAPSGEITTRRAEAAAGCESLGASYQETSFTCSSSGKVGSCVVQSITNGPRIFYYDVAWTRESARSDCNGRGGSFLE
jgi:hypothetical protein